MRGECNLCPQPLGKMWIGKKGHGGVCVIRRPSPASTDPDGWDRKEPEASRGLLSVACMAAPTRAAAEDELLVACLRGLAS